MSLASGSVGSTTPAELWATSGLMALTGRADGLPLVAPDGVVARLADLGRSLGVDVARLAAERAAVTGLSHGGRVSAGGSARLVRAGDEWMAVNLARADDQVSVAAWLELDPAPSTDAKADELWALVEREAAGRDARGLVGRAELLGVPVARLGEVAAPALSAELGGLPVVATPVPAPRRGAAASAGGSPLVVDLSSLWAGPLCSRLLADRGAQVVKVESTQRPDGARRGPAAFYDRMHAGKASVALDLTSAAGRAALHALIARADVVVEASRPRALRGMGFEAQEVLATGRCRAWVSVTGHGRTSDRVAFGDDAAVAGGLVALDDEGPCFVADAVADPLAGVVAAEAVVAALATDRRWLLDVSMAEVAAHVAGAEGAMGWRSDAAVVAEAPRPLPARGSASALGADNARIAAELGVDLE